jgi:hypothetical protein
MEELKYSEMLDAIKADINRVYPDVDFITSKADNDVELLISRQPGFVIHVSKDPRKIGFSTNICSDAGFIASVVILLNQYYDVYEAGTYVVVAEGNQMRYLTDPSQMEEVYYDFILRGAEEINKIRAEREPS